MFETSRPAEFLALFHSAISRTHFRASVPRYLQPPRTVAPKECRCEEIQDDETVGNG